MHSRAVYSRSAPSDWEKFRQAFYLLTPIRFDLGEADILTPSISQPSGRLTISIV